jgi:hypothetical protein
LEGKLKKKSAYRKRVEERDVAILRLANLQKKGWNIQNRIEPQGVSPFADLEGDEEWPDFTLHTLSEEVMAIKVFG